MSAHPVSDHKDFVAASIIGAQADLAAALHELDKVVCADSPSIAFASHALNNYLTVTGGVVELALRRLKEHSDAQVLTWLEGVQHATNMMTHIVGQLMNNAAIDPTKLRFEKADLGTLVRRMCDYYDRVARQKGIRMTFDDGVDIPLVWTDIVAAASVLDNILSNAIKYSEPGTHVSAHVRRSDSGVVCEVKDEGPGLSLDDQTRLFQRGARLTPRPTAGEHSNGYGLAVAKDLIDKLGGDIWCETELGKGSRFSFRLPAYDESVHAAQSLAASMSDPTTRPDERAAGLALTAEVPGA